MCEGCCFCVAIPTSSEEILRGRFEARCPMNHVGAEVKVRGEQMGGQMHRHKTQKNTRLFPAWGPSSLLIPVHAPLCSSSSTCLLLALCCAISTSSFVSLQEVLTEHDAISSLTQQGWTADEASKVPFPPPLPPLHTHSSTIHLTQTPPLSPLFLSLPLSGIQIMSSVSVSGGLVEKAHFERALDSSMRGGGVLSQVNSDFRVHGPRVQDQGF
jgi:hypothetical protein